MRHKIAKRVRREILKRAEIGKEGWIKEGKRKKDWCFEVKCICNGLMIFSADDNELSAYKGALACIKIAEEKSFCCTCETLYGLPVKYSEKRGTTMKEAYQVYDIPKGMTLPPPTNETGENQFKCYCSVCGCPVYSDTFPSLREECPHCKAKFSVDRLMKYEAWTAELTHVGYTLQECGRDQ